MDLSVWIEWEENEYATSEIEKERKKKERKKESEEVMTLCIRCLSSASRV